jgi:Mrp family chromosome partitioning ATPase
MIEPINFFGALRRRWRLIVALAVVGAIVALLVPISSPKRAPTLLKYETYVQVGSPGSGGIISGTVTTNQILFYANELTVKLATVNDVQPIGGFVSYLPGLFASTVPPGKGKFPQSGTVPTATKGGRANTAGAQVTLYAAGPTALIASDLANSYATEVGLAIDNVALNKPGKRGTPASLGATGGSVSGGTFSSPLTGYQTLFPSSPLLARRTDVIAPNPLGSKKLRLLLGLLVGAALALVIILAKEVLDHSIRRASRAGVHFKLPVIGTIPETYPPAPGLVDLVDRPTSAASEAYRMLRMSILFETLADASSAPGSDPFADMFGFSGTTTEAYQLPEPGSRRLLLVTSTQDEPSRPRVVANLAASFAEASERVVVINSGDLDTGTRLPADSVLLGPLTAADIESRMTPAGPPNVWLLSMRHFMRNSGQLVSRAPEVFDALRTVVDVVIIEAPSFLRFHHAEAMVHAVDAVVVVVESGVTEVSDAKDMGDVLRRLGAPVLGIAFTGQPLPADERKALDAEAAEAAERAALRSGGDDASDLLDALETGDEATATAGAGPGARPS